MCSQINCLPALLSCYCCPTCRSRVLFTSRNKAAQGLRLATDDVIKYHVECLTDEASRRVLLAGLTAKRVLNDAQLQVALDFCKGLPLALKLLNRALLAEEDPKYLIKHMATHASFSVDKEDELVSALRLSVECLSEELQIAWLDLTWIYLQGAVPLLELQCVFGEHTLQKLLDRSLITLSHMDVPGFTEQQVVAVRLHDLLLKMAECIYGPQGKIQCFTLDKTPCFGLRGKEEVGIAVRSRLEKFMPCVYMCRHLQGPGAVNVSHNMMLTCTLQFCCYK